QRGHPRRGRRVRSYGKLGGGQLMTRVGIIGTGVMGTDHARLLSTVVAGATLSAVFDVDRARAAAVAGSVGSARRAATRTGADRTSAPRVLDDPVELIRDEAVEAVLVA